MKVQSRRKLYLLDQKGEKIHINIIDVNLK